MLLTADLFLNNSFKVFVKMKGLWEGRGSKLIKHLEMHNVMATGNEKQLRFVTHLDVNSEHVAAAAAAFSAFPDKD